MNAFILAAALISTQQYHYGHFLEGSETTVFAGNASVLSGCTGEACLVAGLPAGTPVLVAEEGTEYCRVEAGGAGGWVPTTDLALVSLPVTGGLFQLGITGLDGSGAPAGEARLIRGDGSFLACPVELRPFSESGRVDYCIEASEVPAVGLTGVETALMLSFVYEACGYLNSDILLVATDDELVPGPEARSVSEAGIFHHVSSLVLPPELGEDDVVEISTRHTEWTEDGDSLLVSLDETSLVRYVWNGRFFELEP